jgi:hypothetical protein
MNNNGGFLRMTDTHLGSVRDLLLRAGSHYLSAGVADATIADGSVAALRQLLFQALKSADLPLAGASAEVLAAIAWGSRYYPQDSRDGRLAIPAAPPDASLTSSKLRHDAAQLGYLASRGLIDADLAHISEAYDNWAAKLEMMGSSARQPLQGEALADLGHVFNRIVHVRETPRVSQALGDWDADQVQASYFVPPGVAVVDDFLTQQALQNLWAFCLESTVWSSNRHGYGRIGAQFHNGFVCPLLIQIVEELQQKLPQVIGLRYPFRHLWGYKTPATLPADATVHADFAAVNVNFWLTPDECNLDPRTGGLVVYGVDAPAHWTFHQYNGRRTELIQPFLARQGAKATYIPYRQNRAVIFNSDLFHGTAESRFRDAYENQRINITMLFGTRAEDTDHRNLSSRELTPNGYGWRSAAFARRH